MSPTHKTPVRTPEKVAPASSGNDDVAEEAPVAKHPKPPSPPASRPAAGVVAEEVVAQLAQQAAEIRALEAQVDESTRKAQVEALKEQPKRKAATITMSTEAGGVSVDSNKYWVDVGAKKNTNVVAKPGPKPDSRAGLRWPGYCVEGCDYDVCVANREEPIKTGKLNLKRVSKKPST